MQRLKSKKNKFEVTKMFFVTSLHYLENNYNERWKYNIVARGA